MRTSAAFPSKYLKKEDLNGAEVAVTIDRVEIENVGQGEEAEMKPVVYFQGKAKGMVLNRGNADAITEAAAGDDEMDNWRGLQVVLYTDTNVMFQGRRVGGLRIKPARIMGKGGPKREYTEIDPPPHQDADIPF